MDYKQTIAQTFKKMHHNDYYDMSPEEGQEFDALIHKYKHDMSSFEHRLNAEDPYRDIDHFEDLVQNYHGIDVGDEPVETDHGLVVVFYGPKDEIARLKSDMGMSESLTEDEDVNELEDVIVACYDDMIEDDEDMPFEDACEIIADEVGTDVAEVTKVLTVHLLDTFTIEEDLSNDQIDALIKDELDAIHGYAAMEKTQQEGSPEELVLDHIKDEEEEHIGELAGLKNESLTEAEEVDSVELDVGCEDAKTPEDVIKFLRDEMIPETVDIEVLEVGTGDWPVVRLSAPKGTLKKTLDDIGYDNVLDESCLKEADERLTAVLAYKDDETAIMYSQALEQKGWYAGEINIEGNPELLTKLDKYEEGDEVPITLVNEDEIDILEECLHESLDPEEHTIPQREEEGETSAETLEKFEKFCKKNDEECELVHENQSEEDYLNTNTATDEDLCEAFNKKSREEKIAILSEQYYYDTEMLEHLTESELNRVYDLDPTTLYERYFSGSDDILDESMTITEATEDEPLPGTETGLQAELDEIEHLEREYGFAYFTSMQFTGTGHESMEGNYPEFAKAAKKTMEQMGVITDEVDIDEAWSELSDLEFDQIVDVCERLANKTDVEPLEIDDDIDFEVEPEEEFELED